MIRYILTQSFQNEIGFTVFRHSFSAHKRNQNQINLIRSTSNVSYTTSNSIIIMSSSPLRQAFMSPLSQDDFDIYKTRFAEDLSGCNDEIMTQMGMVQFKLKEQLPRDTQIEYEKSIILMKGKIGCSDMHCMDPNCKRAKGIDNVTDTEKETAKKIQSRIESYAFALSESERKDNKAQNDLDHYMFRGIKRVKVIKNGWKGRIGQHRMLGGEKMAEFQMMFDDEALQNGADVMDQFGHGPMNQKYNMAIASDDNDENPIHDIAILCEVCDEDADKKCSRCKAAWYCGTECQREGWKTHRENCGKKHKEMAFCYM